MKSKSVQPNAATVTTALPQVDEISIVVPVKNNQAGINNFLESFFATHNIDMFPKEIIVVDNNSDVPTHISEQFKSRGLAVKVHQCHKPGPASARNVGAANARGSWLLFVDSDCIATPQMLTGYQTAKPGAVAYAGFVNTVGNDKLSKYYVSQEIHLPVRATDAQGNTVPSYLVTANALVHKATYDKIAGFDERFVLAGGEDIDLAFRLLQYGRLEYAPDSAVLHEFDDGIRGFYKRFTRYGKGNRLLEEIHGVRLLPRPAHAKDGTVLVNHLFINLQVFALLVGYCQMYFFLRFTGPGKELLRSLKGKGKR